MCMGSVLTQHHEEFKSYRFLAVDVYHLFVDFEKGYDSIKRESLYDILIKFGVPKKLVGLIKACLDGTQSKVRIGNYLPSSFWIENGLEQGDVLSILF